MNVQEIPLAFDCHGDTLIGIVHQPEQAAKRGVLAVVAGGPQYRAGCCRQLVYMARDLSANGIPVMRFDYRGMGDGGGDFSGFQYVEDDLEAALRAFSESVPGLEEVVLWGGCDAASAILIHAWRHPIVTGMILGNPYAHTNATEAVVTRKYYLQRLRDKAFWTKLLTLQHNPLKMACSAWGSLRGVSRHKAHAPHQGGIPFTDRMLAGLKQFRGHILLLMSGQSLTSQEFDVLMGTSTAWHTAVQSAKMNRVDIAEADQAFSSIDARQQMIIATRNWLNDLH